jgi:hypothetical protein
MTDTLKLLIDQEVAKLKILEAEVAVRKQRIDTLRSMQNSGDIDALLSARLSPSIADEKPVTKATVQPPSTDNFKAFTDKLAETQRRPKGEVKNALLTSLTAEPQHLSAIQSAMAARNVPVNPDRLRAMLWNLKNSPEKLVDSPVAGKFMLTDMGHQYIKHKGLDLA